MARPPKEINWEDFDKLCALQCTAEEIASFFQCNAKTLNRACRKTHGKNFEEYYAEKSQAGRVSLRRKQYQVAMAGNVTMLIWLGKQLLGQRDKVDTEVDVNVRQFIVIDRVKNGAVIGETELQARLEK